MTIIKLCSKCNKPVAYPNRYCKRCQVIHEKETEENERLSERRYYQNRDKKYLRFYNSKAWAVLKDKRLQDSNYMCDRCKELGRHKMATEVHHIKPIQTDEGWERRLDYDNTKSVCIECHNYYHNRFQKKGGD